uniref:Uncharacterized protein n=1 Tax=Utricularia reniformis TaxID=192314 RepID=A0A1Y0AZ86_9LAMI|nr:hypothetical protein AEK19_MT0171 [Utricularia reniformis]ART30453.1 hypothetical protein AEK19_MT0171 [Utricularia reniformis]
MVVQWRMCIDFRYELESLVQEWLLFSDEIRKKKEIRFNRGKDSVFLLDPFFWQKNFENAWKRLA